MGNLSSFFISKVTRVHSNTAYNERLQRLLDGVKSNEFGRLIGVCKRIFLYVQGEKSLYINVTQPSIFYALECIRLLSMYLIREHELTTEAVVLDRSNCEFNILK